MSNKYIVGTSKAENHFTAMKEQIHTKIQQVANSTHQITGTIHRSSNWKLPCSLVWMSHYSYCFIILSYTITIINVVLSRVNFMTVLLKVWALWHSLMVATVTHAVRDSLRGWSVSNAARQVTWWRGQDRLQLEPEQYCSSSWKSQLLSSSAKFCHSSSC